MVAPKNRPHHLTGDEPPGTLIGVRKQNYTAKRTGGKNGEHPLAKVIALNVMWNNALCAHLSVPHRYVADDDMWDSCYKKMSVYKGNCYRIADPIFFSKEFTRWREEANSDDKAVRGDAFYNLRIRVAGHFQDLEEAFAEGDPPKKIRKKKESQ